MSRLIGELREISMRMHTPFLLGSKWFFVLGESVQEPKSQ